MRKLIFGSIMFASSVAHANIDQVEADFDHCMANAESTADYNNCTSQAYHHADEELNRVYKQIKAPLVQATDPESKEILRRLVKSERAWIKFLDANCELVGVQMLGGSGEGPMVTGCLATTTISRVRELQTIFEVRMTI